MTASSSKHQERRQQKQRQATKKKRKQKVTWLELAPVLAIFGITFGVIGYVYCMYGSTFFLPPGYFDYKWTAEQWREHLDADGRTMLLIGGPHKSGTTILWDAIRQHPELSSFGDSFDTGVSYSEGILMQSVYPKFGIGMEFRRDNANKMEGLGKYALANENLVHWTEDRPEAKQMENLALLMNRFAPFWDNVNATVLVEKSPPNAVISRFLDALYNVNSTSNRPVTKFLFITRHPIANAYSHEKVLLGQVKFNHLLENYVKVHEYMINDMPKLRNRPKLVRLEDFAMKPSETLKSIFEWLGVDSSDEIVHDILYNKLSRPVDHDPNAKYRKIWCEKKINKANEAIKAFQKRLSKLKLGYDIVGWCDGYSFDVDEKSVDEFQEF
eukprot:CAMPEP_0196812494 /NCGR_PEP_ID=MMETSP1362-20130617/26925_1 /TAXON_ID=163516 /ORGANISM="Leptocylindrus danicus, Strain CCMP1856" /LENGTH=383 /DNA_ID=CAMNT_0042188181 /DNA_START=12 /DNA_END=1163 /DNA_ORIENTATION=-